MRGAVHRHDDGPRGYGNSWTRVHGVGCARQEPQRERSRDERIAIGRRALDEQDAAVVWLRDLNPFQRAAILTVLEQVFGGQRR